MTNLVGEVLIHRMKDGLDAKNPVGMKDFVWVGVNPPYAEELDAQNPVGMTGFSGKSAMQ